MLRRISAAIGRAVVERPAVVAVVSALAAVMFASAYLDRREARILRMNDPVPVVIASHDLIKGHMIDHSSVKVARVPRRFVQPTAFSDVDGAVGRVASILIPSGTHLTPAIAQRPSERSGVSPLVPPGRRAMAVTIDDGSAERIVRPNDFVDVLATFDLGNEAAVKRTTLFVIENVQVLSVGNDVADYISSQPPERPGSGMLGGMAAKQPLSRRGTSVALAVTPAEASILAFSQASGRVALAVRPVFEEGSAEKLSPTTISAITGGHDELASIRNGFREYRGR